jgi:hypothetical protein
MRVSIGINQRVINFASVTARSKYPVLLTITIQPDVLQPRKPRPVGGG